ncbi:hypothetical protein [Pantoea sp. JZ2]|uniref:hypothetical protein n=1 Tax=Pantoea sp. JZ2 TaxID=2654189 RepID=UPI002B483727|nr:hypothetical protein [Pantoea sp. JZ2]
MSDLKLMPEGNSGGRNWYLLKGKRADYVGIGINIAADNLRLEHAAAGLSGFKGLC